MSLVPGDDPRERAHRDLVVVGGALARQRCGVEPPKQRDGGAPYGVELGREVGGRAGGEAAGRRPGLVVETLGRLLVGARGPRRAGAETPDRESGGAGEGRARGGE